MDHTVEGFELSPQQRRIWQRLRRDGAVAYQVQAAVPVVGRSGESLLQALEGAVQRHEILRTVFRSLAGMDFPLQMISARGSLDWSITSSVEDLEAHCRDLRRQAFDLENGPSLRACWVTTVAGDRYLILALPALCCDGFGLLQLVEEVLSTSDQPSSFSGLGEEEMLQYADLAQWQNELLTAEETAAGREFWRSLEVSDPRSVRLPARREAAAEGDFLPKVLELGELPLEPLAGENPEAWLLTCWRALLGRRGAPADLLGVVFDGRRYAELEAAVGPLAKALPVPLRPFTELSSMLFTEALKDSASALEGIRLWQESFTWKLLQEGEGPAATGLGEDGYLPLGFELSSSAGEGSLWAVTDRFELLLECTVRRGGCRFRLSWDERFYDEAEIRRLGEGVMALAAAAADKPESRIDELPAMGEGERRQLLGSWSGAAAPGVRAATVPELFTEVAQRHGDRRAVVGEDGEFTYAQLARRVDLLAARIQAVGAGPETIVGLPATRRTSTIIGLLAILRAGAAYLPLEMSQPAARRSLILEQAGARWVLGQVEDCVGLTSGIEFIPALPAEAEPAVPELRPAEAGPAVCLENLAYVLFTSGSTGTPKGVAVTHGQLTSYVAAASRRLDLASDGTYAVVSTLAADLGHTMIFPALLGGGCLFLPTEDQLADGRRLASAFEGEGVDYLKIVPSLLAVLLEVEGARRLLPRRVLVCGGEALSGALLERVSALAPELRVFNHFGPTETTVGVVAGPVVAGEGVSLGHPLDGCRIFLADPRLTLVPVGSPGEILVGGRQVARGYVRRPAATAERFVPDPFSGAAGGRLYRTGDRARFRSAGALEFLGRRDHQVKIRGYRVELGEIEGVLLSLPGIAAAVVILHRDADGREALAAYFETAAGYAPGAVEVRSHLAEHLPEFMVPLHLVALEALPRNANGKIDRQALPAPEEGRGRGPGRTPTPLEEMMLDLWRPLLKRQDIALTDDFFALGGHSLTAMQLGVRLGKAFGVQLAMDSIFEAPTPERLARVVEAALNDGDIPTVPPLTRRPAGSAAPLSFAQERHWFLQQLDPVSPLYNIRGALRVCGALRVNALEACFREILDRHELLRTAFPAREIPAGAGPSGDLGPVPEVLEDLPFGIAVVDLQSLRDDFLEGFTASLAAASGLRPFAMDRPPFLRVEAFRLAEEEHLLVLTLHHIVADRWTLNLLIQEIAVLYPAFSEGRPSPLPPLELQYADFAHWQRGWLRGAVLERELAYWRKELEGAPVALTLPQARRRPARLSGRSGRLPFRLAAQVRDDLQAIGRRQGMTLFQTLLALFQVLLHGFTGDEDIVVGSPVAGRNQIETEGLIGCFINALALRARLRGDPSFVELLGRLRQTMLGAYTHQELPFERLVQELSPVRSGGVAPIFQVVFNFADRPVEPLELPGLVFTPWRPESVLDAKYDLILSMFDSPKGVESFLTYSSDLFDSAAMTRVAAQLQLLAERIAFRPEARLSELVVGIRDEEQRARVEYARQLKDRRKEKLVGARRSAVGNLAKEA